MKTIHYLGQDNARERMGQAWQDVQKVISKDDKGARITIESCSKRTLQANACMWAALADVAKQVQWHGRWLEAKQWKIILSSGLKQCDVVPNMAGNGFVDIGQSTSEMSVKEMGEMIEFIYAYGAEVGVKFSAPEWMA